MPISANMMWVTLVPKCEEVKEIKDYRPISTVGCMYKSIAKVLANWMRYVMDRIVGET